MRNKSLRPLVLINFENFSLKNSSYVSILWNLLSEEMGSLVSLFQCWLTEYNWDTWPTFLNNCFPYTNNLQIGMVVWHFFTCLYAVYISSSMICSQQNNFSKIRNLIHEFIDKIVVHAPRYFEGKIDLYYNDVGILLERTLFRISCDL